MPASALRCELGSMQLALNPRSCARASQKQVHGRAKLALPFARTSQAAGIQHAHSPVDRPAPLQIVAALHAHGADCIRCGVASAP